MRDATTGKSDHWNLPRRVGTVTQTSFLFPDTVADNLRFGPLQQGMAIVWIPGLLAGMLMSGANPIHAAIYQFVTISMIFSSSGLTALILQPSDSWQRIFARGAAYTAPQVAVPNTRSGV